MKKVFALLSVVAVFAFASCEDKKGGEAAGDTTAVVVPAAVDTTPVVSADTTVKADTVVAK